MLLKGFEDERFELWRVSSGKCLCTWIFVLGLVTPSTKY